MFNRVSLRTKEQVVLVLIYTSFNRKDLNVNTIIVMPQTRFKVKKVLIVLAFLEKDLAQAHIGIVL